MKLKLTALITEALGKLKSRGILPMSINLTPQLEQPKDSSHGDLSCNIAMVLAKHAGLPPRELAVELLSGLPENSIIKNTEIAGPGFINFHLNPSSYIDSIVEILQAGDTFGKSDSGKGRRIQVEFVSANPTGPLHVGHGRGAAIGDSLSRLLEATGWSVHREFYYNDAGQQIDNLALSVQARAKNLSPGHPNWPKDGYRGDYVKGVAIAYQNKKTIKAADREITAKVTYQISRQLEIFLSPTFGMSKIRI